MLVPHDEAPAPVASRPSTMRHRWSWAGMTPAGSAGSATTAAPSSRARAGCRAGAARRRCSRSGHAQGRRLRVDVARRCCGGSRRFIPDWDDAMDANLAEVIGPRTRSSSVAAATTSGPDSGPAARSSPSRTSSTESLSTSRPPLRSSGSGPTRPSIEGDLADFVRDLKDRPGGDIGIHASISVARTLLAAGVVDELRLVIAPAIAGSGRRLLDGLPPLRLEVIRSATTPGGYLLVCYRVAG